MPFTRSSRASRFASRLGLGALAVTSIQAAAVFAGLGSGAVPALATGVASGVSSANSASDLRAETAQVMRQETAGGRATPAGDLDAVIVLREPRGAGAALAAAAKPAADDAARHRLLAQAAPPASAAQAVVAWARAHGLTVSHVGSLDVLVSGSPAAMAAAFAVPVRPARSPLDPSGGARYLAATSAPKVPAGLASLAQSVVGLDNRPVWRHQASYHPNSLRVIAHQAVRPAAGAGITVATVQFSGWTASDAVSYAKTYGIPLGAGQITNVSVDGADPAFVDPNDTGGAVEVALDVEAVLAVAPAARQRVYVAPNNSAGSVDVYLAIAHDAQSGRVQVASTSWGLCEWGFSGTSIPANVRTAVQQLAAAHGTLFAASGDDGSDGCAPLNEPAAPTDQVSFPASLPEVVAVGGTRHDQTTGAETAWSVGASTHGSGGGQSALYPRPAYQSSLTVTGSGTCHLANCRLVPDIASLADPATGMAVIAGGVGLTVGGTSLASPLSAGSLATALSSAARTTSFGIGDIHTLLYSHAADFTDVTSGTNGLYPAAAGFDEVTGMGVPKWDTFAPDLTLAAKPLAAYHPVNPARILDTRSGLGIGGTAHQLGAGSTLTLTVKGAGGLPASGISAVVLNITATRGSAPTVLSVYPTGYSDGPSTSVLNALTGQTVPNLVTTKVSVNGTVTIRNSAGSIDVLADVQGWYARDTGLGYHPVTPKRVLDTRPATRTGVGTGIATLGAGKTLTLTIAGVAGVPATGAQAVTLNVTATDASAPTFLSVYPSGFAAGANSSNLNLVPKQAVANLVISKIATAGSITIRNGGPGSVDVIADLQGWYDAGGALFLPLDPQRLVDTRSGWGAAKAPVGSGKIITVRASEASVGVGAAVVNLTGVTPSQPTFLTIYPSDAAAPGTSSLNLVTGVARANLTTTRVPTAGTLSIRNNLGTVNVVADAFGYFGT